ncbi:uncharacterized protein LOC108100185 [Drosophila ficusphila]|uniref:uncharacterized protein LOC108100185 n=1 Tax=Drosophila ficusphila TaxID=30025 RepID=UPI0007E7B5ED|nr:uncharacterized protein LOC108100185 [Drosophila ficusphila]XP_017059445.1 uncharacterized protein LOC108100185 [Drosophila ficusphila]
MPFVGLGDHPNNWQYRRHRNQFLGRHHVGDCVEEQEDVDPRQRGILQSTSCRRHRERLRSSKQSDMRRSLVIIAGLVVVCSAVILLGIDLPTERKDIPEQQEDGLWSGAFRLLGLEQDQPAGYSFMQPNAEFCSPQALDLRRIFRQMNKVVLNQEQAMARLERALSGTERFRSVALIGPPGVGKTLAANTLRECSPWPENAHSYSWNTRVQDEARKFRLVRQYAEGLSNCGVNLLIIDNLTPCDHGLVPIFNRLIVEREGDQNRNQTVLVVYIFNLETEMYWEQCELLQELPAETAMINFRFFNRDDLQDCLTNELLKEHRALSREKESQILDEAMEIVQDSGCKSLRMLLLKNGNKL